MEQVVSDDGTSYCITSTAIQFGGDTHRSHHIFKKILLDAAGRGQPTMKKQQNNNSDKEKTVHGWKQPIVWEQEDGQHTSIYKDNNQKAN